MGEWTRRELMQNVAGLGIVVTLPDVDPPDKREPDDSTITKGDLLGGYEYRYLVFRRTSPDEDMVALNALGADGWKVISIHESNGWAGNFVVFLMREK